MKSHSMGLQAMKPIALYQSMTGSAKESRGVEILVLEVIQLRMLECREGPTSRTLCTGVRKTHPRKTVFWVPAMPQKACFIAFSIQRVCTETVINQIYSLDERHVAEHTAWGSKQFGAQDLLIREHTTMQPNIHTSSF